jgi:hypothetical protein
MKRIFLIGPLPFYDDVVRALAAHQIEPVMAVVSEEDRQLELFRALLPKAEVISSFTILGGTAGGMDGDHLPAPCLEVLRDLAPIEATALQMIDRCNQDSLPVLELRRFYLKYISLWTELLNRYHPDALIFHGTPHMGHDYVLYWLARRRGIATLIVERTYLNERLYIRRDLQECPIAPCADEDAVAAEEKIDDARLKGTFYNSLNRELNDLVGLKRKLSWSNLILRLVHGALTTRWIWEPSFSSTHGLMQRRPSNFRIQWDEMWDFRNAKRAFDLYCRLAANVDWDRPYVYYPLHFEPERTTVPDGGLFTIQTDAIRRLADALPTGWQVLVKEHPRQFRRGNLWPRVRSLEYYHRLAADPRVRLVPLETSTEELIARSRVVATISGTSGWEALQIGKPAIVFGYPWYRHAPGVFTVDDDGDCGRIMDAVAAGNAVVRSEAVRAFAAALAERRTFHGCFATRILKMSTMTSEENGRNYAAAIAAELTDIPPPASHGNERRESPAFLA